MRKLIRNATIYTMNDRNQVLENTSILINDGIIVEIAPKIALPSQTDVIDASGKIVTPGLIDIHTHVGIWGEMNDAINDACEYSEPFTPTMEAIDGINPQHFSFSDARKGGVTTVQTGTGSANPIGGIWSIIKTAGTNIEEMMIVERSGLKGALGENPKNVFGQQYKKTPYTRMAIADIIRQGFEEALPFRNQPTIDLPLEKQFLVPFIEVLNGEMPLHLHSHRADDIATAVRIAKNYDIQLTIEHCTEGYQIIDYLKDAGYPVTLGPYMMSPGKYEVRNGTPASPRMFHEAGIPFAISTDHPFTPIEYLILCAAEAVKYGLPEMEALQSITLRAAKIAKIDHRVGSIEIGKDADLVIWSEHPFLTESQVLKTIIDGQVVFNKEYHNERK